MLRLALATVLLSTAVIGRAATGDKLPAQSIGTVEEFDANVRQIETRYRLGISPWPDAIGTRIHAGSGEKQIWTGGNFLGLGIQPLWTWKSNLGIETKPLPPSALPPIAAKADAARAKGQITAAMAANIKAARWSSGIVASRDTRGDGYYEVRWRLAAVRGRWTAFYLFDWERGIEADIAEQVEADGRCFQATTHQQGGAIADTMRICLPFSLADDYHSVGATISSGQMIVYVDRIERGRIAMPNNAAGARWNWLVLTAIGGDWLENPGYGVNNVPAPGSASTLFVDYVRSPAS